MKEKLNNILLKHILPAALLIYFGLGFILWLNQTNYIYFPDNQIMEICPGLETNTINLGATRTYFKENNDTLVILYHGNAGSACDRTWYADEFFEPLGLSYLLVEYAGYSNDTEKPSADKIRDNVADVISFIEQNEFKNVVVISESIGGGAAAEHSALLKPDLIIFTTPFASLQETAQHHYPVYPAKFLLQESFDNVPLLKNIDTEIHIIHGDSDNLIPLSQAEKLFDSLQTDHKSLTIVEGAGHNDIYNYTKWQNKVYELLSTYGTTK